MPSPFLIPAATALFEVVADLFKAHGSKTAVRNAEIIEKAGPAIVEIAKTVTGGSNEQQAVEKVLGDPQARTQFREAVAVDLDRLVGLVERLTKVDDDSRDRASLRAAKETFDSAQMLIEKQFWMLASMSAATVISLGGALWLKAPNEVMVGLVVLFTGLVNSTAAKWATMVEYRFGSSAGSAAKDIVIAEQRDRARS